MAEESGFSLGDDMFSMASALESADPIGAAINLSDPETDKTLAETKAIKQVPADSPDCKSSGVTNKGVIESAKWKAIIAGGMLVLNTMNSLRMAKLQRDLGKKYLELAQDYRDYYEKNFRPLEEELVNEAMKLPKYVRDKDDFTTGQMLISARNLTAGKLDRAVGCTGRYCTGQRAAIINDQLLQQASIESMIAGLAFRNLDKEQVTRDNLRWDKREQVEKIGRDIPTDAVSYANLAAGIFGAIGQQAGKSAEGAMQFLLYANNRNETIYPPKHEAQVVETHEAYRAKLPTVELPPQTVYKRPPRETEIIIGNLAPRG